MHAARSARRKHPVYGAAEQLATLLTALAEGRWGQPSTKIGIVNEARTPILAKYSVYITDAPLKAQ